MEELERVLREHARRYPRMAPVDAVKLIYQNEFGGGHMIRDEQGCLTFLRREYAATVKNPSVPLYEDIGGGMVRVNLAALAEEALEQLGQAFLLSAAERTGSLEGFREKLDILRRAAEEGIFSFSPEGLEAYLREYEKAGFPAVSHSREYREAYRPAYRIVLWKIFLKENKIDG